MTKTEIKRINDQTVKLSAHLVKNTEQDVLTVVKKFLNDENVRVNQLPRKEMIIHHAGIEYVLGKKIGRGGFSSIFACKNDLTVIIKIETVTKGNCLKCEAQTYEKFGSSEFVPKFFGVGCVSDKQDVSTWYIILEKYQTDLSKYSFANKNINAKRIFVDVLKSLQFIHSKGQIHGDIKSNNILLKYNKAVLADFGLSKSYLDDFGNHNTIENSKHTNHFGTVAFMSCDMHRNTIPSRRSDLESLGWVMIEIFDGILPWRHLKDSTEIGKIKFRFQAIEFVDEFLKECFKTENYPNFLKVYFETVWSLKYEETPDYEKLSKLFM